MDPFGMGNSFSFGGGGGGAYSDNTFSSSSYNNRRRSSNAMGGGGGSNLNSSFYTNFSQDNFGTGEKTKKRNVTGGGGGGYTSECIVPCTISMIEKALLSKRKKEEEGNESNVHNAHTENLVLHNKAIGAVVLRGWINSVEKVASRIKFTLCDGTGSVDVHYNISNMEEEEEKRKENDEDNDNDEMEEKKKLNNEKWRDKKIECIKKGKLVCVIGTAVTLNNNNNNNNNDEGERSSSVCTVEACHFRPITDYNEYAYYADIEVVFASTQMKEGEGGGEQTTESNQTFSTLSTADGADPLKNDEEGKGKKEDSDDESVHIPESLSHITNALQKKIIKVILKQPENKAGRIATADILTLIHRNSPQYSLDAIRMEIDTLLEEGDIMYTQGDFVDIV